MGTVILSENPRDFFCTMLIAAYTFNLILGDIILFIVPAATNFFYVIQRQNYFFLFPPQDEKFI